jgi:hypothetical protein
VRKIVDSLIQTGSFEVTAADTGESMDEVQSAYVMYKEPILEAWARISSAPPSPEDEERIVELLKLGRSCAKVARRMGRAIVDVRVIRSKRRQEIEAAWKMLRVVSEEPHFNA